MNKTEPTLENWKAEALAKRKRIAELEGEVVHWKLIADMCRDSHKLEVEETTQLETKVKRIEWLVGEAIKVLKHYATLESQYHYGPEEA